MAFLKQNSERAKETKKNFGLLPEGDYEVFAVEGKWRNEAGKTPNANFTFVVRSDVEQEGKGRKVFHSFYVSQDPEKLETSLGFIERFNDDLGVPDGVEFATQQEWINYVLGKPIMARIGTRGYNGKEYNEIKWFNPSEFSAIDPSVVAAAKETGNANKASLDKAVDNYSGRADKDPFDPSNGGIDISDDDFPF